MAKPTLGTRRNLLIAGTAKAKRGDTSDAALDIAHAFYCDDRMPGTEPQHDSVFGEYWNLMVCLLCERISRLEYELEIERRRSYDFALGIKSENMPTAAFPDNAPDADVLREVLKCVVSWEPDARLLGNVRAGDIARAVRHVLPEYDAPATLDGSSRPPVSSQ